MAELKSLLPIREPNFTQVPNTLLDGLDQVSDAELRLLLLLCRQTFGWHRQAAKMSITYMQKGAKLSSQGVVNGIKKLLDRELVGRTKNGMGFEYFLVVKPLNMVEGLSIQTSQRGRGLPLNVVEGLHQEPLNMVEGNKQIESKQTEIKCSIPVNGELSRLKANARQFMDAWSAARNEDYSERAFVPSRPSTMLLEMFAQGFTVEELIRVARLAWKLNGDGFWSKQSRKIEGFVKHFEDIRNEVDNISKGKRSEKNQLAEKIPLRMI